MTTHVGAPDLPGLRYLEPLGSGGFSDVYLYERDQPRIKVAVKLMRADVLDDAQRRQFVAEADAMAELAEHPFIVPVLGAGTTEDGRPYLVMRYYPPPDLGERVAAAPMSVPDALRTGIQLASAIETAHRSGIIHRDIKPSNILVSSYGVPGLSDFGIAGRAAEATDEDEHLGVSMPWSPPEVLSGASNGSATSDVYSLGATMWNLLVGRSPFTIKGGDNSERAMFTRILHSKPPVTGRAEVPGSLDRLLQQAMSKNPAHRPQSAMELARHLQRVEQELRLARTEIVVLEGRPETEAATRQPAMRAPDDVDASRTKSRPANSAAHAAERPTFVAPVRPDGPAADDVVRGTEASRPEVHAPAEPTALRRPTVVEPAPRAPTVRRPRQVPSDRTPAVEASGGGHFAGETVRRPTQVVAPADPEASETGGRGNRRLLAGITAAVLILVIVVAGALLGRGGDKPDSTKKLPNGTTPTQATQGMGGAASPSPPSPPVVTGKVVGTKVVFTWPQEQAGDTYYYEWDGAAGQRPANDRRIVLPLPASGKVCVAVHVVRAGLPNQTRICKGS
ncbi:MAG TPA: protein kinase [Marmoricola sp.]|nr:protein kinase [Marmoricola sp.]